VSKEKCPKVLHCLKGERLKVRGKMSKPSYMFFKEVSELSLSIIFMEMAPFWEKWSYFQTPEIKKKVDCSKFFR